MPTIMEAHALERALELRDLTDPRHGRHAMQHLIAAIAARLVALWGCCTVEHRAHPIVPIVDNYDRLHYEPDGPARDARYTRYVTQATLLRTQTSAMIPPLLATIAERAPADVLLVCPGLVYRRDAIDRLHTGEPHQLDLWRVGLQPMGRSELLQMIAAVVEAALPGMPHRCNEASHPYTLEGLEVEVQTGGAWVEIGECGLALPDILREAGLPDNHQGLAMGLGLDRLLMLRKGISDIRLLRSDDDRVANQMLDLDKYRPVSAQPAIARDLSLVVAQGESEEQLGDRVRVALGAEAEWVETVAVGAETSMGALPAKVVARLGIRPGQKNALVRVVLRHPTRALTQDAANRLRDQIYAALHEGPHHEWACGKAPET